MNSDHTHLILPCSQGELPTWAFGTLTNNLPDYVLINGKWPELQPRLSRRKVREIDERFFATQRTDDRTDQLGNIPMRHIYRTAYQESPDKSSALFGWSYSDQLSVTQVCASTITGILSPALQKSSRAYFPAHSAAAGLTLSEFNEWYDLFQRSNLIPPIWFTNHGFASEQGELFPRLGACAVLLDLNGEEWLEQCCWYWNLRAINGRLGDSAIRLFPFENLDDDLARRIADWADSLISWEVTLVAPDSINGIEGLASAILDKTDFRVSKFNSFQKGALPSFCAFDSRRVLTVRKDSGSIAGELSEPFWARNMNTFHDIAWIGALSLRSINETLPARASLKNLEQASNRLDQYLLSDIEGKTRFQVRLPKFELVALQWLKEIGFEAKRTDKARYLSGILSVCGGTGNSFKLIEPVTKAVIARLSRGGRAVPSRVSTLRNIQQNLPDYLRWNFDQELANSLNYLLSNGLAFQGFELRCPSCDLKNFFKLESLSSVLSCPGCQTNQRIPLSAEMAISPNQLLVRAVDQGSLPVLDAIRALQGLAGSAGFNFIPGLELDDGNDKFDIDILAVIAGEVVFCEVKSLEDGGGNCTHDDVALQMRKMVAKADQVGVRAVILFSQMETEDPGLKTKLDAIRAEFPAVGLSHAYKVHLEEERVPILPSHVEAGHNENHPSSIKLIIPKEVGRYNTALLAKR